jgi:hypothetical protein
LGRCRGRAGRPTRSQARCLPGFSATSRWRQLALKIGHMDPLSTGGRAPGSAGSREARRWADRPCRRRLKSDSGSLLLLKRRMFGRAGLALPRKRVLLAASPVRLPVQMVTFDQNGTNGDPETHFARGRHACSGRTALASDRGPRRGCGPPGDGCRPGRQVRDAETAPPRRLPRAGSGHRVRSGFGLRRDRRSGADPGQCPDRTRQHQRDVSRSPTSGTWRAGVSVPAAKSTTRTKSMRA